MKYGKIYLLIVLFLAGCLPEPATVAELATFTPTFASTNTPTVTQTIVWFPPTNTFTPFPTREVLPTLNMMPGLGLTLLADDFSDKSGWATQRVPAGSVAYGSSELTLAVSSEKGALISLRKEPQADNALIEIDALPSLCKGADAYGLLVRAASAQDHYRLLANCSGQLRFELVKSGRAVALQDWVSSGQVVPGALLKTRLGVWAFQKELRVFVNGEYQFTVRDTMYTAGGVGVFARASGDSPVTVSFSNLSVQQIEAGRVPTPVPTPTITPKPIPTRLPTATEQK